jgi:WD40 repeat protein
VIWLRDVRSGKEVHRLTGHGSWTVGALCFSPDGKRLASGGRDHAIHVWDLATGRPLHHFVGHRGAVHCLAFSPDGRGLASGATEDATLLLWDIRKARPRHAMTGHYDQVNSLAYSGDGKWIATGDGSNGQDNREAQVRLWDATTGHLVRQFFGHLSSVQGLAFAPDSRTLASAGWDARVRLWDVPAGTRRLQIRGRDTRKSLAFAPGGKALLAADAYGGGLTLLEPRTGRTLRDLGEPKDRHVVCARWIDGGKRLMSLEASPRYGEGTEVRLWDPDRGTVLRAFRIPVSDSVDVPFAISPDGKKLASCDGSQRDPVIQLWDGTTGRPLAKLRGHTGYVVALAFSPDGRTLASGSWDTTILLWDVP